MIIKQTIHACHNQTGQSFSGINFTSKHTGCKFPCLLHRKNPPVGGLLSRSIITAMYDVTKFFNMVTTKYMTDRGQLTVPPCNGLATLGRNHFPPCYTYTCSRFIAYALTGRLRRGAIKRFEVQTESRFMRGSNMHHRLSKAGSKVNHERAGYTFVGSKISTRLVLLDFLNF